MAARSIGIPCQLQRQLGSGRVEARLVARGRRPPERRESLGRSPIDACPENEEAWTKRPRHRPGITVEFDRVHLEHVAER
jgi:hypothetical protein